MHKIVIEILMTTEALFLSEKPESDRPVFSIPVVISVRYAMFLGSIQPRVEDRMLRAWSDERLPLADALHLGPSKLVPADVPPVDPNA